MGLLTGELAAKIGLNKSMLAIMEDGVLTSRASYLDDGIARFTDTEYAIKGFYDTIRNAVLGEGQPSQRVAVILGYGLEVEPKAQDKITLMGSTDLIQYVEKDPAGATWTLYLTNSQ